MSASLYKPVLIRLMSYLDGTQYPNETEFDKERLVQLTPKDLMRWFNHRTFGDESPGEDARAKVRSSAIGYWKKAISFLCQTS